MRSHRRTHLRDDASGESNLPEIRRGFAKNSVAVISYAVWEEGLVTARGNPKQIKSVEDLARPGGQHGEPGSGRGQPQASGRAFAAAGDGREEDSRLPAHSARGISPAAWQVQTGAVDCCIATRAAARVLGLGFIPLVSERYDLAIRRQHVDLAGIQALLDTLSRSSFRRELESLGGYDTKDTGARVL